MRERHAGVLMPLFSAASSGSWGIGELGDVVPLARWLASGGFDRLMLLPLNAMARQQSSPYSAMSAMAIDPIYVGVSRLGDFARAGGTPALGLEGRMNLEAARAQQAVAYEPIRRAKDAALRLAFDRFAVDEWQAQTPRAAALAAYIDRERWWLADYGLYVTLAGHLRTASWRLWPERLRDREAQALAEVRQQLAREILCHQYVQWIAETEWQEARAAAHAAGVSTVGDFTFTVEADSVDVWTRQSEFALDVSAGAPPDAFSATGQDWNLPMYRWDAIAGTGFAWLRQRAQRMAALYDGIRIDHVVGFYRSYGKPAQGEPFFSPGQESDQLRQGEAILRVIMASGASVLAEDLGTIPDFVRASLARLGIGGSKVLRWEHAWHEPGQPPIDPQAYPPLSAALTGTHDTEPLAAWWEHAGHDERVQTIRLLFAQDDFARRGSGNPDQPWTPVLRDGLLELAFRTASRELFIPIQDVFGWRNRINTPASISDENWTWRLPWPVDRLEVVPEAAERAAFCRALAERTGRSLKGKGQRAEGTGEGQG